MECSACAASWLKGYAARAAKQQPTPPQRRGDFADYRDVSGTMKKISYALGLLAALVFSWLQIQEINNSRSWPAVEGTIVTSGISQSIDTNKSGSRSTKYDIYVHYDYVVDGMPYSGNRIAIRGTRYSSHSSAQSELQRYPVGRVVKVYYNPQDPEKSVLKPYLGNGP